MSETPLRMGTAHYLGEQRLPLPGIYPVVTWQLNVTMHQASKLAKFVSVIREPADQLEIERDFEDLAAWDAIRPRLFGIVGSIPDDLAHMTGIKTRRA